jgi:release factor glutamine methyltransferase
MQNQPKTTDPDWTIIKILQWTTSYFRSNFVDSPRSTAEILLAHTLGLKRIDLYLRYDQPLVRSELNFFRALIKRRIKREPVAYIVGSKEFWNIDLAVTRDVLIPRPETECLVEEALTALSGGSSYSPKRVLEVGTGSGAIILAIASEKPEHDYFASDISVNAAFVAFKNAKKQKLDDKIYFFCGDWFLPLNGKDSLFDMVLSNPPYIKKYDIKGLQPEIGRFEPLTALDGGEDGLAQIRNIVGSAYRFLNSKGHLIIEIGHDQKEAVYKIVKETGSYHDLYFRKDYSGFDRIVCMRKR